MPAGVCRYLLEKGARLDAVNNDGELAIDLADGTDMENLLSDTMETQGAIDSTASVSPSHLCYYRSFSQPVLMIHMCAVYCRKVLSTVTVSTGRCKVSDISAPKMS